MDYRKMFDDKEYLYAYDLDGSERTLQIERVTAGELVGEKARKTKKPMVSFVGEKKKLAINKTNGKVIAQLYGTDTDQWGGKLITIFPTTTDFGGQTVDCIRVRPQRPESGELRRIGNDRAGGGANGKGRVAQSKSPRAIASEASAIAAQYLIGEYDKCDGSPGFGEDKLAELKIARGRSWPTMFEEDRKAVADAALAAKSRIDAAAAGGGATASGTIAPAADRDDSDDDPSDPAIDEDEAAELLRQDREAAARGE